MKHNLIWVPTLRFSGLALLVFAAPAISQEDPETDTIEVVSANDLSPPLLGEDMAVPAIAFSTEDGEVPKLEPFAFAPEAFGNVKHAEQDTRDNLPGIEDDRPRFTVHEGENFELTELPVTTPKLRPDWMIAHFIDVGQGDATLLEFSCGVILIDTGGQSDDNYDSNLSLKGYLDAVFSRRPDLDRTIAGLFLTHPHIDHTRGTELFWSDGADIKINALIANSKTSGSGSDEQNALVAFARANDIDVDLIDNDEIVRLDGLTNSTIDPVACDAVNPAIRVLWGTGDEDDHWENDANNNSVVIRVDFGGSSFLFTGDLEESAQPDLIRSYESNPELLDVDVYQVGHHGSRNGTTAALVEAMTPKLAVIGAGNPADKEPNWSAYVYGHPNLKAINALRHPEYGVTMRRQEVSVPVGIKGANRRRGKPPIWRNENLSHAIFASGWDGDIAVAASSSGEIVVKTD